MEVINYFATSQWADSSEKYRIGVLNGRHCRGEASFTWETEIVWMKLEIASAPPLKFLCSTSKAGTASAVRKSLVKAFTPATWGMVQQKEFKSLFSGFFFPFAVPKKRSSFICTWQREVNSRCSARWLNHTIPRNSSGNAAAKSSCPGMWKYL